MNECPVCGKELDQWGYCFYHCHYCFKPLEKGSVCSCGFEQRERPAGTLPEETPLDGGKYIIGGVLGKGGFGITYLGWHTKLKSRVAIKEFFPSDIAVRGTRQNKKAVSGLTDQYETFLKKFENEAVILEKFNSLRNIVHVKDLIRENNTAYIIMEYVEGDSLKELLVRSGGTLPWDRLIPMLDPMLTALQKIHQEKIIHRDISPDNILIHSDGEPVLIDFGTARIGQKTGGTVAVGKDGYAPIEQMEGADSQDPRTDIYALGATYYKALTGKTPDSSRARAYADKLVPVKDLVPEVPQNISDAVMKALAEKIEDRWNSVSDFREALNRYKEPVPEEESTGFTRFFPEIPDTPEKIEKKPHGRKKPGRLLILLIPAALFLLGFLVWFFFKPNLTARKFAYISEAESGSPDAQVMYGHALYEGYDLAQDYAGAAEWYRKAAEQGYPDGEYYLARCYFSGNGVGQDYAEYEKWMNLAAEHGHVMAQLSLARFYEAGYSGEPDPEKAEEWYRIAAKNGNAEAEDWLESHQ